MPPANSDIAAARVANAPLASAAARANARARRAGAALRRRARLIAFVGVGLGAVGLVITPALEPTFCRSKQKATKLLVDKYAYQAYVQWQTINGGECPASIDELSHYLGRKRAVDSYGNDLVMICRASTGDRQGFFGIASRGKDGRGYTRDDVLSWTREGYWGKG